jgi:hypothetical protein
VNNIGDQISASVMPGIGREQRSQAGIWSAMNDGAQDQFS